MSRIRFSAVVALVIGIAASVGGQDKKDPPKVDPKPPADQKKPEPPKPEPPKTDPNANDWVVIKGDLGADAVLFDDKNTPDGAAYTPETTNPKLTDCPAAAALQDITGATFTFDVCDGDVFGNDCDKETLALESPLDIGIPGLSLKAAEGAPGAHGMR